MDGLRTTRVLVIDDRRDEAQGVIDALARDGIGAVYYSQDVRTHPRKPLTGIRLAALDMNLEDLPTSDPVAATATILSVLRNLVDKNNGPYLAIAWTKHKELVDEFRRRAAGLPCPPIASVSLIKPRTGQYNFASIARRLKTALDDSYPLGFLGFWEQLVHDSTSDIIQMVSPASDWPVETKKTLATLLRDSASTRGFAQSETSSVAGNDEFASIRPDGNTNCTLEVGNREAVGRTPYRSPSSQEGTSRSGWKTQLATFVW